MASQFLEKGLSADWAKEQSLGGTDHPWCRNCVVVILIHWVFSSSKSHWKTERLQHWKHELPSQSIKSVIKKLISDGTHYKQARSNLWHTGDDKHPTIAGQNNSPYRQGDHFTRLPRPTPVLVFNQKTFTAEQLGLVANLKLLHPSAYLSPLPHPSEQPSTQHTSHTNCWPTESQLANYGWIF